MFSGSSDDKTLSSEAMAIARMYASWAPTYNRILDGEDIDKYTAADKVAEAVRSLITPDKVSSILDLATGTGAVVIKLRDKFKTATATGLDISEPMMDRSLFTGARLKTMVCDIERMQWPVPDQSADLITCAGALSMIGDLDHVLKETDRTLTSGGLVVMSFLVASQKGMATMSPSYGFRTYKRSVEEMENIVQAAGFKTIGNSETFIGFSGPQFRETHSLIAFTR
jgi:ubiquinone/menaquinone biosynthesis C-methylase UbiE